MFSYSRIAYPPLAPSLPFSLHPPLPLSPLRHAFATLSFLAETFIFIYVGMDALDTSKLQQVRLG